MGESLRKIDNLYLLLFSLVQRLAWKKYPAVSDTLQFSPHPWNPQGCSSTASETLKHQTNLILHLDEQTLGEPPHEGKKPDLI